MPELKVNEKPYKWLQASKVRFNYLYGGAGSSKSWTVGQFLVIERFFREPNIGIVALRRTKPEVRDSCWEVVNNTLRQLDCSVDRNLTTMTIFAGNGSRFRFDGVDDVLKKKSVERINYLWLEEPTELNYKEFLQLNLRARAYNPGRSKGKINQVFLTFNPEDPVRNEWLKDLVDQAPGRPDSRMMRINYDENPFLSPEERAQIDNLATQDEEYNKIYRLGQWATPTHIIYDNWDVVPAMPRDDQFNEIGYGLDFGFKRPTALLKIGTKEDEAWIQELIYQPAKPGDTPLTNTDLIQAMETKVPKHREPVIIADASEPARIEEIAQAGFNVHPAMKGKDSVGIGIDRCKRLKLHITADSTHVIREIKAYKNKVDRTGSVLDEPLKVHDHAMDAMRYYLTSVPQENEAIFLEVGTVDGF
jgi:phage terminase large subunit